MNQSATDTASNLPIVIVGSGHAGLTLAREIRQHDKECPVVILSRENICAYYKPNLSKAFSSQKTPDQLVMKTADTLSAELNLQLISQVNVQSIDANAQHLEYVDTHNTLHTLAYEKLVLATGASTIHLPASVVDPALPLAINNLDDYRDFRAAIDGKKSVLIIGAGFVGCELASDLVSQGYDVSVVDRGEWPLHRAVPEVMGTAIRDAMAAQGVRWYLGKGIESISQEGTGCVARFNNWETVTADVIVSAIGLRPNIELAQQIGAKVGFGIKVDAYSQTSIHQVYALGDSVEYMGNPLPFIAPATQAAKALALTLTGKPTELVLPPLAVPVKIGACPTIICPSPEKRGLWEVQGSGVDLEAHYLNEYGHITGFALTGSCISKKNDLVKQCQISPENHPLSAAS